ERQHPDPQTVAWRNLAPRMEGGFSQPSSRQSGSYTLLMKPGHFKARPPFISTVELTSHLSKCSYLAVREPTTLLFLKIPHRLRPGASDVHFRTLFSEFEQF